MRQYNPVNLRFSKDVIKFCIGNFEAIAKSISSIITQVRTNSKEIKQNETSIVGASRYITTTYNFKIGFPTVSGSLTYEVNPPKIKVNKVALDERVVDLSSIDIIGKSITIAQSYGDGVVSGTITGMSETSESYILNINRVYATGSFISNRHTTMMFNPF